MFPVTFPKEILQFQVSFGEENNRWKYLRNKIANRDIVAIPFQDKIYAISTISIINDIFSSDLISEIERIPITINEIERNNLFKELFLNAILLGFSKIRELGMNRKRNLLWRKETLFNEQVKREV